VCTTSADGAPRSGFGGLFGLLLGEAVFEGLVGNVGVGVGVGVGERHAFEMVGRGSDIMLTPGCGTSPTAA